MRFRIGRRWRRSRLWWSGYWWKGAASFAAGGLFLGGLLHAGSFHAPPTSVEQGFRPIVAVPEPLPAITRFPVVSVEKARGKIRDNETVLGVVVGNEARAYPINQLTGPSREILNDVLGGHAIAATW